ncbi:MAG: hypothetical protein ACFFG0_05605 [Candidatus Thorarchaeota archaeon]
MDLEYFLLHREDIYKEEKWQRKHVKKILSLDWNIVRKKLKKRRKKKEYGL